VILYFDSFWNQSFFPFFSFWSDLVRRRHSLSWSLLSRGSFLSLSKQKGESNTQKGEKSQKSRKKKLLCCVFCVFCAVFFSFILLSKRKTQRNVVTRGPKSPKVLPEALPDGYGKLWEGEARNRPQKEKKGKKCEENTCKKEKLFSQILKFETFEIAIVEISKLNRTNVRKSTFIQNSSTSFCPQFWLPSHLPRRAPPRHFVSKATSNEACGRSLEKWLSEMAQSLAFTETSVTKRGWNTLKHVAMSQRNTKEKIHCKYMQINFLFGRILDKWNLEIFVQDSSNQHTWPR